MSIYGGSSFPGVSGSVGVNPFNWFSLEGLTSGVLDE